MSKLYDSSFAERNSYIEMYQIDWLNLFFNRGQAPYLRLYQLYDNMVSRDAKLCRHGEYRQSGDSVANIELEHHWNGKPDSFKTYDWLNIPTRKVNNAFNGHFEIFLKSSVNFALWFLVTADGIEKSYGNTSIAVLSKNENNRLKREGVTGDNDFLKIYNNLFGKHQNQLGFKHLIDSGEACFGSAEDISNFLIKRYL